MIFARGLALVKKPSKYKGLRAGEDLAFCRFCVFLGEVFAILRDEVFAI